MKKKINCVMLVDDDEDDNFFHEMELANSKLVNHILIKDSGKKALGYLKSGDEPHTDLIFLDINMPIMNGWEFLAEYDKLTKDLKSKAVVIMLSTSENPTDIEKSKGWACVSDYLTKPLTVKILEDIIDKYF
jgi:response regulator RpfG family c-di-GMP phosphodiesterase